MKPDALRKLTIVVVAFVAIVPVWCWGLTVRSTEAHGWRRYELTHLVLSAALTLLAATIAAIALAPRGRRLLRGLRCTLVFASAAFGWLCVESPAIFFGHDYQHTLGLSTNTSWFHTVMANNRRDPDLIHVHHPGQTFRGDVQGNLAGLGIRNGQRYAVDVRYDRNGFRNHRDLDHATIAVIGDSFVEAAIVPYDDTLCRGLERALSVPTANLGQIAYGFQQELVVLKRYAVPLGPKLVVWCLFGGNDLRDAMGYDWLREHWEEVEFIEPTPVFGRLLITNLPRGLVRLVQGNEPTDRARNHMGRFLRGEKAGEPVFFGHPENPQPESHWRVGQRTLRSAAAECARIGARFVVVYIPRKYRVYRDHCAFEPDSAIARWSQNDFPNVLHTWCAREGIDLIDTTSALQARVAKGDHVYYTDDVHWNVHGHAVATRLITNYLERTGWRP